MRSLKTTAIVLASVGALLTTSCSSGTSAVTCVAGRNVECACTSGAKGAQTCTAAGIFSPCSCPGGSANTATSDDELIEGMGHIEKSKTTEARELVKKMYDGARAYYMDPNYARGSITPIPPQFPPLSVGPTPPLGTCCSQGGECEPSASQWDHETWIALMFSVDDPHYYSYTYITGDPFTEFTVRANGDLDCDGEYSTFEMLGIINAEYSDGPAGSAGLARVRELE